MKGFAKVLAATAMMLVLSAAPATAGNVHIDVPAKVDPGANYLIYLHGVWPERNPLTKPHPRRGIFEYENIVNALAGAGFEVISELRTEKTNPRRYARTRVVAQIDKLKEMGVPANRITVAGFSKGGHMVLLVSALAKEPKLNLVNMAGCAKGQVRKAYENFLANDAARMQGRMLSIYDETDQISGTCEEAKAKSAALVMQEEVLEVGDGQGTFYRPRKVWIDKIAAWAKSGAGAS